MKKILLIGTAMLVSVGVFAQGTVNFSNIGAPSIKDPNGAPASSLYCGALYYAPSAVTDPGQFQQIGAAATFVGSGIVLGGTRTTPSTTAPGGTANFQVRAWLCTDGSWEQSTTRGESVVMSVITGNATITPATTPGSLVAPTTATPTLNGFQITTVPEPSVVALGLLGAGALLLLRRRK